MGMLDSYEKLMSHLIEQDLFYGSVLIRKGSFLLYFKNHGFTSIETQQHIDDRTNFELASVSKPFTAMAIMILMEQGRLTYEDPVEWYLPELPYKAITVRHLLNHTSGLPDYMLLFHEHWDKSKIATNMDVLRLLAEFKPASLFEPGTKWEYSNTGYVLLALIIERVSGGSYSNFLKKHIFDTVGMNDTRVSTFMPGRSRDVRDALGYLRTEEGFVLPEDSEETSYVRYLGGIYGDGTVRSTPRDLLAWDRALYDHSLVQEETWLEAIQPTSLPDGSSAEYGFGWIVYQTEELGRIVSHGGSWPGYSTTLIRYIDKDACIIYLSNAPGSVEVEQGIVEALECILYDKPYELPQRPVEPDYISVAPEILQAYVGTYELDGGTPLYIQLDGEDLYIQVEGQSKFLLRAVKETEFVIQSVQVTGKVVFVREANSTAVNELVIHQGMEFRAVRVGSSEQEGEEAL